MTVVAAKQKHESIEFVQIYRQNYFVPLHTHSDTNTHKNQTDLLQDYYGYVVKIAVYDYAILYVSRSTRCVH